MATTTDGGNNSAAVTVAAAAAPPLWCCRRGSDEMWLFLGGDRLRGCVGTTGPGRDGLGCDWLRGRGSAAVGPWSWSRPWRGRGRGVLRRDRPRDRRRGNGRPRPWRPRRSRPRSALRPRPRTRLLGHGSSIAAFQSRSREARPRRPWQQSAARPRRLAAAAPRSAAAALRPRPCRLRRRGRVAVAIAGRARPLGRGRDAAAVVAAAAVAPRSWRSDHDRDELQPLVSLVAKDSVALAMSLRRCRAPGKLFPPHILFLPSLPENFIPWHLQHTHVDLVTEPRRQTSPLDLVAGSFIHERMSKMAPKHECAACAKGEGDGANLNTCAAGQSVNRHKKECRARASQLFDEALFKQPPPEEDCAVCFLQLPYEGGEIGLHYQVCCGKRLCHGCMLYGTRAGNDTCPFCRKPMAKSNDEVLRRLAKRMEAGDADAFGGMGAGYLIAQFGLPHDIDRGLELTERAAELGSPAAHYSVAQFYLSGEHVQRNMKKALSHNQQAAMRGHSKARHHLGCDEMLLGNSGRAVKHWMIASASGNKDSLDKIKLLFTKGSATKADYERALRAYQSYQEEVQSDQRTGALKFIHRHWCKMI